MEDGVKISRIVPCPSNSVANLLQFKQFVRENQKVTETVVKKSGRYFSSVSGSEAKRDYEKIVGRPNDAESPRSEPKKPSVKVVNVGSVKRAKKRTAKNLASSSVNVNGVMKAAETNDVKTLGKFLESDFEFVVNAKDEYGWSAMMCASCAGSADVVRLLLEHSPNLNVTDKKGNSCLSLAKSKGHHDIVQLINSYLVSSKQQTDSEPSNSKSETEESGTFYCKACKESVTLSAKSSHLTSTMHRFQATRASGIRTAYGIPESNVGFQILLNSGWDREKGLGPEGSGQKFPPKTILKQDRAGLGAKKYVAKVTHNLKDVKQERIEKMRTINKREREKRVRKDKIKERELRRALD